MSDEEDSKAIKELYYGHVKTQVSASCVGGDLQIKFSFFQKFLGDGVAVKTLDVRNPLDIMSEINSDTLTSMGVAFQIAQGNFNNLATFRRRINSEKSRNGIASLKFNNVIVDRAFHGARFSGSTKILYEFPLEDGTKTLVEITPTDKGFEEIGRNCPGVSYEPDDRDANAPLAKNNSGPMDETAARAKAIDILLGEPYGKTRDDVDRNIVSQSFANDTYCETSDKVWNFVVRYKNYGDDEFESGNLVLNPETGAMVCAGLPYLD